MNAEVWLTPTTRVPCSNAAKSWYGLCPLVVHYWADLQSVHEFYCYDNIAPNAKCQRVLVLAVCLVQLL